MTKLGFSEQLIRLDNYIQVLQQTKFYGKVTLDIQAGNLLRIVKQESTKLEELPHGVTSEEAQADGEQAEEASAQSEQANEEGKAPTRR